MPDLLGKNAQMTNHGIIYLNKVAYIPKGRISAATPTGVFNAKPSRHVRSQGHKACSRGLSVTWDPRLDT